MCSSATTRRGAGRVVDGSLLMGASRRRPSVAATLSALIVASQLSACTGAAAKPSAPEVRQLWDVYLASKNGQFAAHAGTPSPHWSASEQTQWPMYDLAGFYLPDQAVPEVVRVTPVNAAVDSAYEIETRFWPAAATPRDSSTAPVLTMTVYARREGARWVLANALPYRTQAWRREQRGRISFRVAPALRFDATKAERAAKFVDSLATTFGVTAPARIDYYVAESVDQAMEILGVVVPERFGAAGGFSKPVNFQVFSGIPALGENYRHELAHVVLLPIIRGGSTSLLASEGVPTWFGGTAGRDFHGSVRHLAALQQAQPRLTLDAIVDNAGISGDARNAAGAVLADMLNETGGVEAVRAYLQTSGTPRTMRQALERLLGRSWPNVVAEWQRRVHRLAATGP